MKKINKFLFLIVVTAIVAACSKDEDPAPAQQKLEDVQLSLASSTNEPVEVPAAMANSTDEHAMMVNGYATSINQITSYMAYFEPPKEAVKGSTQITASNGRVAATKTEYLVYTWTSQDISIAYQISQQNGKNVFEIFTKTSGSKWLLYLYAEETTDGKQGQMKIYNSLFGDGSLLVTYTWARNGDMLNFNAVSDLQGYHIETKITINTKSKEGSAEYYLGTSKVYSMTWDTKGNGSWKEYGEDGSVIDNGAWKV